VGRKFYLLRNLVGASFPQGLRVAVYFTLDQSASKDFCIGIDQAFEFELSRRVFEKQDQRFVVVVSPISKRANENQEAGNSEPVFAMQETFLVFTMQEIFLDEVDSCG
jgi:hypothetical protein